MVKSCTIRHPRFTGMVLPGVELWRYNFRAKGKGAFKANGRI
jgi:hypothetical protein